MTQENVLLVLILLVSGYLFCINVYILRWRILRSEGYHTFLISATWGIVVVSLTFLSRMLLNSVTPQYSLIQYLLLLGTPTIEYSIETIVMLELTFGFIAFATLIPWVSYRLSGKFGYSRTLVTGIRSQWNSISLSTTTTFFRNSPLRPMKYRQKISLLHCLSEKYAMPTCSI